VMNYFLGALSLTHFHLYIVYKYNLYSQSLKAHGSNDTNDSGNTAQCSIKKIGNKEFNTSPMVK
jgi:hypothetical protein